MANVDLVFLAFYLWNAFLQVDGVLLAVLIHFAYTHRLVLGTKSISALMVSARMLQFHEVISRCEFVPFVVSVTVHFCGFALCGSGILQSTTVSSECTNMMPKRKFSATSSGAASMRRTV